MPSGNDDHLQRPSAKPMRTVLVPVDRPFVLVYLDDTGYPNVTGPFGQPEGCAMAYMLLELARHYTDRKYTEYTGVERHLIEPPGG
jgi:hypothetical protein